MLEFFLSCDLIFGRLNFGAEIGRVDERSVARKRSQERLVRSLTHAPESQATLAGRRGIPPAILADRAANLWGTVEPSANPPSCAANPTKTIGHTHLADRALTMLQCNPLLSHLLAISRKLSFSSRVEYVGCLENENAYARPRRPCRSLLAQPLVECFSPVVHYDAHFLMHRSMLRPARKYRPGTRVYYPPPARPLRPRLIRASGTHRTNTIHASRGSRSYRGP